jgi:vacuolar-type H+-ATPase subunit D/Vma8
MTCTTTETLLGIVRDDLRTLKEKNSELTEKLGQLRRNDEHMREITTERSKRKQRRFRWFMVVTGILFVLEMISLMIPIK